MKTLKTVFLIVVVAFIAGFPGRAVAGGLLWEKELDSEIRFKKVHDTGIILVGTERTVYGFDPQTGQELWKIEKLMKDYDPEAIVPPSGSSLLIYEVKESFMKPAKVRCMDVTTGAQVWELSTDAPKGWAARVLGKEPNSKDPLAVTPGGLNSVVLDRDRNQFLIGFGGIVLVAGYKPKLLNSGVLGVDVKTGGVNFVYDLPEEASYIEGGPIIVGDLAILDWAGFHTFKLTDGTPVAGVKFERALKGGRIGQKRALAGSNAPTQADADGKTAYVVAEDRIVAVDVQTGQQKWATKGLGTALPEMYIAGDRIVARMGGMFSYYVGKEEKFKEQEPYGILVVDKNTGNILTDNEKMDKKMKISLMTSLLVHEGVAYFGTRNSFRAVDLSTADYKYAIALHNREEDQPKRVAMQDGKVVLILTQTTTAFNPTDGSEVWSKSFEAPKLGWATKLALRAVTVVNAMKAASRARVEGGTHYYTDLTPLLSARFTAAVATGQYNYVLSGEGKKPALVGVSLKTGEADRSVGVDSKEPDYIVDEVGGLLINAEKEKTLQVFDVK